MKTKRRFLFYRKIVFKGTVMKVKDNFINSTRKGHEMKMIVGTIDTDLEKL